MYSFVDLSNAAASLLLFVANIVNYVEAALALQKRPNVKQLTKCMLTNGRRACKSTRVESA